MHLKDKDIESWIKEEVVGKERLNFERLNQTSFDQLVNTIQDDADKRKNLSKLQGGANYDILQNPFYADRYTYTPCRFPKRSKYAITQYANKEMKKSQLDLVRVVCDLPYLTEKRAKAMEFNVLYIALERQTVMHEKLQ